MARWDDILESEELRRPSVIRLGDKGSEHIDRIRSEERHSIKLAFASMSRRTIQLEVLTSSLASSARPNQMHSSGAARTELSDEETRSHSGTTDRSARTPRMPPRNPLSVQATIRRLCVLPLDGRKSCSDLTTHVGFASSTPLPRSSP
eukprot:CAMPEP_0113258594 /NCGR_PEP_ID=MMETSP0008_2-20120614/15907_1 /TAXON_ID=97485 /ORGANISM="Prymnesium parvum" /LENGTH=147 /DNA_ID=CAMNT_0000107067 /DNA_START=565 /DNA_END=1008 /DNA_ORIENTATION=- /assembly_acc=CAM_ASM_000153